MLATLLFPKSTSISRRFLCSTMLATAAIAVGCNLAAPAVRADGAPVPVPVVTVTATIVGPDGKPVTGTPVFLMKPTDLLGAVSETKTDALGHISFEAPRSLLVVPSAPLGIGGATFSGKDSKVTLRLASVGTISGRVTDAAVKPVAGVSVGPESLTLAGPDGMNYLPLPDALTEKLRTISRADGSFAIAGLPSGSGSVTVALQDARFVGSRATFPLQNPVGGTTSAKAPDPLVALPGALLTGRVINAVTGKPAENIRVMAQGVGIQDGFSQARTATDGTYRLIGLPEGRFNVGYYNDSFIFGP